jgi:hypothetical protein
MPKACELTKKFLTDGKENFLACQFTLHLAAHYFYFLEFTCQMAMSCFTGLKRHFLDFSFFFTISLNLFFIIVFVIFPYKLILLLLGIKAFLQKLRFIVINDFAINWLKKDFG